MPFGTCNAGQERFCCATSWPHPLSKILDRDVLQTPNFVQTCTIIFSFRKSKNYRDITLIFADIIICQ